MQKIGVVIGVTANGMFWEAVAQLLENVPDIDLYRFESEREFEWILRRSGPQVLILDQSEHQQSPDFKRFYDLHPGLAIIALDPSGAESILRLRDLGRDLLVQLVRTLATDSVRNDCANIPQVRLVNAADVKRLAVKRESKEPGAATGYVDTREHLEDIRHWIELCLHECLVAEAATAGDTNIPGWAMSTERARSLLGSKYLNADEESLRKARQQLEAEMSERADKSARPSSLSNLVAFAEAFNLSELDKRILALVLAPELDGRYARVFGFLNDDLTRRRPTPSLLRQLLFSDDRLAWDVRQMLVGEGSLAKYRLITVDRGDPAPASEVGLSLAPEVVAYLLAEQQCSPEYGTHLELLTARKRDSNNNADSATRRLQERLAQWRATAGSSDSLPIIQLIGNEATLGWFKRVVGTAGDPVVEFHTAALREQSVELVVDRAIGASRVAVLHDAVLLVTGLSALQGVERERLETALINELRSRVRRLAVHGHDPWLFPTGSAVWQVERGVPTMADRALMWRDRARALGAQLSDADARTLASTTRLDEPEIDATLRISCSDSRDANLLPMTREAARSVARKIVPSTVRRIEATFTWDDIVLPEPIKRQVMSIPQQVRHSSLVLDEWGFASRLPYGRGVGALFSGVSGTGKTMAAQILASELSVDLFQVDLAQTVSKYIGETEKNLDVVFDAAERASAVLLFDEADALFGKRTEVRDAHDRYANVEVAYLLQRVEAYEGLVILTSNLKANIDAAFLRRLRFVVDFPMPDAADRERIWRVAIPTATRCAVDVDTSFLARRLALSGGSIQAVAVNAAFAAAAEDCHEIHMRHIMAATRAELRKKGMYSEEAALGEVEAQAIEGVRA